MQDGAIVRLLDEFSLGSTRAPSGSYAWGAASETMVFTSSDIESEGSPALLTLRIVQAVSGTEEFEPAAGKLTIAALDGSSLGLSVTSGEVTLEVDTDGNSVIDGTRSTIWDDL